MTAIAKAIQAGSVKLHDDDDEDLCFELRLGIVLEFRTAEDLRQALKDGLVAFELGEYPKEQSK